MEDLENIELHFVITVLQGKCNVLSGVACLNNTLSKVAVMPRISFIWGLKANLTWPFTGGK